MTSTVYLIDVIQDDINRGVRGDSRSCPIAHAWNRATHGGLSLFVPSDCMPDVARQFLADFDAGRAVHPFRFEMEVVT